MSSVSKFIDDLYEAVTDDKYLPPQEEWQVRLAQVEFDNFFLNAESVLEEMKKESYDEGHADAVYDIQQELNREIDTLQDGIKEAISAFVFNMEQRST